MTASTTSIAVRFDNDLFDLIEAYAESHQMTQTDFIGEKLEDIYVLAMADKAYQNWVEGTQKNSFEEAMQRYN